MKNALFCGIFSVCLFAFTASPAHAEQPKEAKAVIISVDGKGTAKVRRKAGTESVAGAAQELRPGDKITTDAASVVQLRLIDGTIVRIGFNTEYRLEDNQIKNGMMAWVFELTRGTIRAMVEKGPRTKDSKFRVNTPAGTMGVRGTELMFEHNQETKLSSLYVLEGKVGFGARDCEAVRDCIEVVGGQRATIKVGDRKPNGPHNFNVQELAKETAAAAREAMKLGEAGAASGAAMLPPADLAARLSVLSSFGKLGKEAVLLDDEELMKMARNSGQQLMDLQDTLLGRDAETRKLMENSAAAGTYGDRLKVGESAGVATDPDHMSGVENVKKFKKSEEAAKDENASSKKGKNATSAKAAAEAKKLKDREASFKRAVETSSSKNALGDLAEKIDQAKKNIAAAKKKAEVNDISLGDIGDMPDMDDSPSVGVGATVTDTSTATTTDTSTATDTSTGTALHIDTGGAAATNTATQTSISSSTATATNTVTQQEQERFRVETYTYTRDVCVKAWIFGCLERENQTVTETATVDNTNGRRKVNNRVCTEPKETCQSEYIGCPGVLKGRGCKAGTATKRVCTTTQVEVRCR